MRDTRKLSRNVKRRPHSVVAQDEALRVVPRPPQPVQRPARLQERHAEAAHLRPRLPQARRRTGNTQ